MALNLRGPLAALPSVSRALQGDLAVTAGAVGLLTGIPVLCFGLSAPLASLLIARSGLHGAVLVALAGVAAGTVLRSAGGYPAALAGTVVLGLAITVGNIALPVVIGEDFPTAVALVTALYTAALNIGSTLTSVVTPVVATQVGWRAALASWGVLAAVAVAAWLASARARAAHPPAPAAAVAGAARTGPPVWRRVGTWGLAAAFAGQAFGYFGTTAWLPSLLLDELDGLDLATAGASASIFQVTAVAGALCVPLLLRTTGRPRLVLWLVCAAWATLPVGLLAAPSLWWLWCALAGAAQGGGITVVFVAITTRSAGADEGRQTSALVQGAGYAVAALGPSAVGAAHDATGAWQVPLLVIAASIGVLLVAGSLVLPARQAARG